MANRDHRAEPGERACVVFDVLSDQSTVWNVEYLASDGHIMLTVGCTDKSQAEELACLLNAASWLRIESDYS